MPKYPSECTRGGGQILNFQNTLDRAWNEIRMKIDKNFFGILISTRLAGPKVMAMSSMNMDDAPFNIKIYQSFEYLKRTIKTWSLQFLEKSIRCIRFCYRSFHWTNEIKWPIRNRFTKLRKRIFLEIAKTTFLLSASNIQMIGKSLYWRVHHPYFNIILPFYHILRCKQV
jgi:hypothetical protein